MKIFLLIFISNCAWQYECVHEIFRYETLRECKAAQEKHSNYRTMCAAVVENEKREFDVMKLGKPLKQGKQ